MPKTPASAVLHDPVSAILGTRGKIAVLRVLVAAGAPLHQREVARRTGLALRTVELAVDDLLRTAIVERLPGGTEKVLQFRNGHRLAPSILGLLRAGHDHWGVLRAELRAIAAGIRDSGLLNVSVVGRAARRLERIGDPVDLVVVGTTEAAVATGSSAFKVAGAGILARLGAEVRVIGYTMAAAREMWAVRTSVAERLVDDAELVYGESLRRLLDSEFDQR